ncbi:condensation domain-containing protein [Aliiruegeria sabulilitoris]|uniref:condensation domain-containing protein n=1 Tax=Aliiruegeria sabulilitoris TaxID=1510458 RepID=UPI0008320191|nr:condensation domain-containing protein [Aliiruegeria sabulilitoris]NDR59014.1 condensation protein [Pseudoruegeria sp. M32A2M]
MSKHLPDFPPESIVDEFPVTTTQQRCWFLDQIEPGNPALNIAVRWELRGRVSNDSVQRAFQLVTDRHEILRTRFLDRDGEPVQQVLRHVEFNLGVLDLRTTPEADRMARIDAIAREEGARPFDLGKPGLLRATLVRWEAERAMVLLTAHQSVFDGHSIGVLGREVGEAASAFEVGREPVLPELPLQFGDYALWQRDYLESGVLEEEGAWWQEQLAGAPYFELPTDKPRPPQQKPAVRELHLDLPVEFSEALQVRARAEGVTPFTFCYAVVVACMNRLTGASDILMGTQTAGRIDVDLDPLIGVFINNLVLRLSASPESPLHDHLARAREVVEGALAHQSVPFNRLVERLNPRRDAARNPIISMNFNLADAFMRGYQFEGFKMISVPSHHPGSVYDLQMIMVGRASGYRLSLGYQSALFEAETMERLLHQIEACLKAALERPEIVLSELPLDAALAGRLSADTDDSKAVMAALENHPMVDEVALVGEAGRLWAFVTPQETGTLPLESLPGRLLRYLDDLELPSAKPEGISVLADFPRTSRGDINRSLLRMPKAGARRPERGPEDSPPVKIDPTVRERLRAHMREVLSVSDVPPDATFFDLGGHSLLAVRLLTRIRQEWGLELGIATIYEHATLPALAEVVSEALGASPSQTEEDWQILRLTDAGEKAPLVSINSAGLILSTVRALKQPRPATCVRLFGEEGVADADSRSFEEYAADYAKLLRRAHPEGPYLVYGNCVHGNLALEAARILKSEGAEIQAVIMKDVWEPEFTDWVRSNRGPRRQDRRQALRNRIRAVRNGTLSLSAALGGIGAVRSTGILQLAAWLGVIERVRVSDLEAFQEHVITRISAARDAYRPAPVDLPVLHVVTNITPQGGHFLPSIGWEKVVTGPLRTVYIDEVSDHPNRRVGIEAFAHEIEDFLTEIDSKA